MFPPDSPTATFRPVPAPAWTLVWTVACVLVVTVPPVAEPSCTDTVPAVTVVVDGAVFWPLCSDPVDAETVAPTDGVVPVFRAAEVVVATPVVELAVPATETWVLVVTVPPVPVPRLTETVPAVPVCGEACVPALVPLLVVSGSTLTVVPAPALIPVVPLEVQSHEVVVDGAPDVPICTDVPMFTDVLRGVVGDVLVPVVGRPSASVICPVRSRERSPAPASTIARTAIRTTSLMLGCM